MYLYMKTLPLLERWSIHAVTPFGSRHLLVACILLASEWRSGIHRSQYSMYIDRPDMSADQSKPVCQDPDPTGPNKIKPIQTM